jgi:hypothetical protein
MRLDDERAHPVVVRIRVRLEHAVGRVDDEELERVEHQVGAKPHVLALATVKRRHELARELGPYRARSTVRGHDQIRPSEL